MMNRSLKKAISAALVIPMCLSLYMSPVAASEMVQGKVAAEEELNGYGETSGVAGDCKWEYDTSTATLTISSNTGELAEMPDYESYSDAPWRSFNGTGHIECRHIVIADDVTRVGNEAFNMFTYVESIELSKNLKSIGENAFRSCGVYNERTPDITLPESLETIESMAFNRWQYMEEITIPKNVKEISRDAFPTCKKLSCIDVVEDNPYLCSVDGVVYDKAKTTLIVCPPIKTSIEFPETLTKLNSHILSGCGYITELKFTGDVPEIECDAFAGDDRYADGYGRPPLRATAYYPSDNVTWTADKLQNYGGDITWKPYGASNDNGNSSDNESSSTGRTVPHYDLRTDGGTWDGTHYYLKDGTLATDVFFCDGTYTYYLQKDGTAMKDRLTYHPDGEHIIYLDSNGHEVFSNFTHVAKSIAGEAVDDLCFFDVYGYMYVDVTTYDQAGENLYYANAYGVMEKSGWFQFADGNIGYANADGTLLTNQFSYDQWGRMVYFQGNGTLARGLISDGVNYYQMDETDGHLVGMFPVE